MSNLERIPEKGAKLADYQKKYNLTSKTLVHILGTNMALFICILLPIFLIGFIWTDFGMPEISVKFVPDGIVTVALFVIGEIMMMRVGADGGKLDQEYIDAKKVFEDLLVEVHKIGTMLMPMFCEWQTDIEMGNAAAARLRQLRFSKEEWERVREKPHSELKDIYGKEKAKKILELNALEPIDLNEFILLYDDSADAFSRGGVPMSGEDYIRKKTRSWGTFASLIFAGLLTISVAMTLTSDISFARVMHTIFKLLVLVYRMALGYAAGAKAYNTVEVRQLGVKSDYLRNYIRFVKDKLYLKIGDKYGDVSCYVDGENLEGVTNS